MADTLSTYYAQFIASMDGFIAPMKEAQKETRELDTRLKPVTDSLNKIGSAATKAGTVLSVGLTAPIVAFGAMALKNFTDSANATALMENAIRSTGGAAGKTASELQRMASELQSSSIFDDDDIIRKVTTNLLTFTNIAGPAFDGATKAVLNMSTVLGQDLQSSAIQVGKALNDPIEGVSALQRVGVKLTDSQKDLVKQLVESGDMLGAQNVILKELEVEFGGAAEAASNFGSGPLLQLQNKAGDVSEKFGKLIAEALIPFIDKLSDLIDWIDSWDESTQKIVLTLAAVAAAIGPVLLVVGQLAFAMSSTITAVNTLIPLITSATGATTLWGAAMAALPWALVIAGAAAAVKVLYDLYQTWQNNKEAAEQVSLAYAQSNINIEKSIKFLKEHGIAVDRSGKSQQQLTEEVAKLTREYLKSQGQLKTVNVEVKKHTELTDAQKKAISEFRQEVDKVKTSVLGNAEAHKALIQGVKELEKAGIPLEAIVAKLGDKFLDEARTAQLLGERLDPLTAKFAALTLAKKALHDQGELELVSTKSARQMEDFSDSTLDSLEKIRVANLDTISIIVDTENDAMDALINIGEQASATFDVQAQSAIEAAAVWSEQVDYQALQIKKTHKESSNAVEEEWKRAAANITSDLAKSLSDVIFHGGNFKTDMINLAKKTAEGMLQAFLTGLLTPLTNKLAGLGAQFSGLLGKIPGLGGIFGGGATAAGTAGTTAAGGGGISLGAVAGFLTNPLTIGIGAAAIGVTAWLKSQAHHEANTIVANIEKPFWEAWGQILPSDQPNFLRSLSPDEASRIGESLNEMNKRYLALVEEYSKGGSDERLVSNQSMANTQPHVVEVLNALRDAVRAGGGVPQFYGGADRLMRDTFAQLHEGEAVVTREQNNKFERLLSWIESGGWRQPEIALYLNGQKLTDALSELVEVNGYRLVASQARG